jgi:hypothetical protein
VVQPATMEPLRSLEAGYYLGKGRARREVMGPKWLARDSEGQRARCLLLATDTCTRTPGSRKHAFYYPRTVG